MLRSTAFTRTGSPSARATFSPTRACAAGSARGTTVLANIVADVIIPLAALAPAFLAPGGTFVCSGIIDGREDEVRAAIERAGFTVTAHDSLEEWHCFTATLA